MDAANFQTADAFEFSLSDEEHDCQYSARAFLIVNWAAVLACL